MREYDIPGVKVTGVTEDSVTITFEIEMETRPKKCDICGYDVMPPKHDYKIIEVHDMPVDGKNVILKFKKYRYRCDVCNAKFTDMPYFIHYNGVKMSHFTERFITWLRYEINNKSISILGASKRFGIDRGTIQKMVNE